MSFTVMNGDGLLTLNGSLTLERVARLKAGLIEAFDRSERVEINLDGVAEVDVAGLQILCAGYRFAAGRGKTLRLSGISRTVYEMARQAGFRYDSPCRCSACGDDGACLWNKQTGESGAPAKRTGGDA